MLVQGPQSQVPIRFPLVPMQVFRQHKSQLRMQILTGPAQLRTRILRSAFLVSLFASYVSHPALLPSILQACWHV